jgi:hypothetical protein
MNTYKITNLTNTVGKRETKFNSILDIDYVDSMVKKTIKVKPGETVYLTIGSLPLSVHRLRVKNLVSVVEIDDTELKNIMDSLKPKVNAIEIPVVAPKKVVTHDESESINAKKKTKRVIDGETPDNE